MTVDVPRGCVGRATPRMMVVIRGAVVVAAFTACSNDAADTTKRADTMPTGSAVSSPPIVGAASPDCVVTPQSICLRRERSYDLLENGRPVQLMAEARGPAYGSLMVRLKIVRGDSVLYANQWESAMYMRYDSVPPSDSVVRQRVVQRLDSLFVDSRFRPSNRQTVGALRPERELRDAISYDVATDIWRRSHGPLPPDSLTPPSAQSEIARIVAPPSRVDALVRELRERPSFHFFAGGEATYAVAWSPAEGRFVVVYSCC